MKSVEDTERSRSVVIDGVEYVPKSTILPEEARLLLTEVYDQLYGFCIYDPTNESFEKFGAPLARKMAKANLILGFTE